MTSPDYNAVFEEETNSLLHQFMDGQDQCSFIKQNTSGLGDFHLRSAVKMVDIEKITQGKARPRENKDYANFSRLTKITQVFSGNPTEFLVHFLLAADLILMKNTRDKVSVMVCEEEKFFSDAVKRRIRMELNRDIIMQSQDVSRDYSMREEILSKIQDDKKIEYSELRKMTETLILTASSIASKRAVPKIALKVGQIFTDNDQPCKENMIPILAYFAFNSFDMFLGGDLCFYKWNSEANSVEKHNDNRFKIDLRDKILFESGHDDHVHERYKGYPVDNRWNVVSCDVIRMINDKISERHIVYRSCYIMHDVLPSIYPSQGKVSEIFLIGDWLLREHGNNGYKAIKCFEALMTGILLKRCNSIVIDKEEFLNTTMRDLLSEFPLFEPYVNAWVATASSFDSDHHISQMYGLYRLWGHPVVRSEAGLNKVMKIGTQKKFIIDEIARQVGYAFLEEVFLRYKGKWGRYPAFCFAEVDAETLNGIKDSYLCCCLKDNEIFYTNKDIYNKRDWDMIILERTFDLPETFNLTMVIDDKAISPDKEFLIKVSNREARYMDPYERRGVLKWMNSDYVNCKDFLQTVNDDGLDDNDCVIGLYPKERELNSVPRMFSLMSAKMRNYVVVTEHMIADDILPFFPQVTMTDNLLDLTKKIYGTTRIQHQADTEIHQVRRNFYQSTICLNMDFEKWNLNMRYEATKYVFLHMGRAYGMSELFNRTYDIFNKSYIYLSDENCQIRSKINRSNEYELETDGIRSYSDHVGGFEGLRQKGWTVFTVCAIKMILERFPVTYKLMGQGDNQVLMLTMRTSLISDNGVVKAEGIKELKDLLQRVINALEDNFLGLGLPLKTLESWRSEELFLYGKFPVKKGVPLSMSLKRLSRSFPFSNEDSMTMDNVLGSIFTNMQSAAMCDVFHIPAYYMGLFEALRGCKMLLDWHPLVGKGIIDELEKDPTWFTYENIEGSGASLSRKVNFQIDPTYTLDRIVELLCMMPKSLGGSNGISENEFLMRGFPDNQTRDLTYLCDIISSNKQSADPIERQIVNGLMNISKLIFSKSENLDFLVEDPCAINLLLPQTPLTVLRKKIKKVLADNVTFKNKNFMELFKLSNDSKKRELLLHLSKGTRLFPRMLHDCYSASLFGFVDGIVSKVDKTVTVQRMCLEVANEDIVRGICKIEMNYLKFLIWRIEKYRIDNLNDEPSHHCPTNYIRWARNYGWKKEVLGVTVPYPGHILKSRGSLDAIDCKSLTHISSYISDYAPTEERLLLHSLGYAPPYLGSMTKEKITKYDRVALYSSEPLIKRIVRLLKVISWGKLEESNLRDYLELLLMSVSDVDSNTFMIKKDDAGGSLEHRFRDSALKHGALLSSMYGLGTWIHMSTDTFGQYTKGSKNVTLHFQAILCWVQAKMFEILIGRTRDRNRTIKEYHFHLRCTKCIVEIEESIPDIEPVPADLIPSLKSNPYCFTMQVLLKDLDRSSYSVGELFTLNKALTINDLDKSQIDLLYHEHWAAVIFKDIVNVDNEGDSCVDTSILELNKYPRVSFLRIKVELLVNMIIELLIIWQMRLECKRDKYSEKALSFNKSLELVESSLMQCGINRFIGLSVLFSWPEKIDEIIDLYPISIRDSASLSINECLTCARDLLLHRVKSISDMSWCKSADYINISSPLGIDYAILCRYISWYSVESKDTCVGCRRAIISNITLDRLDDLRGDELCSEGHYWFPKEDLLKRLEVINIPEDALSKRMTTQRFISRRKIERHYGKEYSEILMQIRQLCPLRPLINRSDIRYCMECPDIVPMQFRAVDNIYRVLYRSVSSDSSAGYRVINILAGLSVNNHSNNEEILVLGDGTGTTGAILAEMTGFKVSTSTLVDCTKTFPQTFPHSVPTNQLGRDNSLYDNSLSKKLINDIFDNGFIVQLRGHIKKKRIAMIYSDIELEHKESIEKTGGRRGYNDLIRQIWKTKVEMSIVKIRINTNIELMILCDIAYKLYNKFSIYVTPHCNPLRGEFFLLITDRRVEQTSHDLRYISAKTIKRMEDRFAHYLEGHLFKNLSSEYYEKCDYALSRLRISGSFFDFVENWFASSRLTISHKDTNFTSLYHSIAAARNPIKFVHHTDNKKKFEYFSDLEDLAEKIFVLGASLIFDDFVVAVLLNTHDQYCMIRPATLREVDGVTIVERYSYEIIKRSSIEPRGRKDQTFFKPIDVKLRSSGIRALPILRKNFRSKDCMQNVRPVTGMRFIYSHPEPPSSSVFFDVASTTVDIKVSKSCSREKIRM